MPRWLVWAAYQARHTPPMTTGLLSFSSSVIVSAPVHQRLGASTSQREGLNWDQARHSPILVAKYSSGSLSRVSPPPLCFLFGPPPNWQRGLWPALGRTAGLIGDGAEQTIAPYGVTPAVLSCSPAHAASSALMASRTRMLARCVELGRPDPRHGRSSVAGRDLSRSRAPRPRALLVAH